MQPLKKVVLAVVAAVVLLVSAPKANAASSLFELGVSTPARVAVLFAVGAGNLSQVVIGTAAAGDYCAFYDSASVSGLNDGLDGSLVNKAPRIATLAVTATNTTTPLPVGAGMPFVNGCVGVCSAARHVIVKIDK